MPDRSESRPLLLTLVLLLSVLLHAILIIAAVALMPPNDQPLNESYEVEAVTLLEDDDDEAETNQVVSLDKPERETKPPDDAKVSDRYSQKVEREMVRKRDGRPAGGAAPSTPTKRPPPPRPKAKSERDEASVDAFKTIADDSDEGLKTREDTSLSVPDADNGKAAPEAKIDPRALLPSFANSGRVATGTGPKDYLDVEEGDKDLINRKETRYWAFFDRMKTAVRRQWRPSTVYRSHDPLGQVYGVQDRLTILKVTLNADGSLRQMRVEKPSGLEFMDDEAVRAFTAAQPYPNLPEALKDERGLVSFRFGFMFEIQSRGGRIIRFR